MSIERSLLWYDLETFGTHPGADRIAQVAWQRTDEQLQPIEEPVCLRVRAPWYYLPDPEACLITGLTPQRCADGVDEPELAQRLWRAMSEPATVSAGYNSIRFDDEFVRHLFWRQLLDPYAREWQGGNQRFDLLDVARLCHALRPEGLQWPLRDDGCPSFRLEELATANALPQPQAHDALSDVQATVALARLLHKQQPRLYAWARQMADKQRVRDLLQAGRPLVHVSGRYWGPFGCARLVLPLGQHAGQRNKIAVYDLMQDPRQWAGLEVDALAEAIFRRRDASPPEWVRPAVKFVHIGRCPMLAPASVLQQTDCQRIGIDVAMAQQNAAWLVQQPQLGERLLQALQHRPAPAEPEPSAEIDPELSLYQGFVSRLDRQRLDDFRSESLAGGQMRDGSAPSIGGFVVPEPRFALPAFDDARLAELAWRWQQAEADPTDPHWRQILSHRAANGHGNTPPWPTWREQLLTLQTSAETSQRVILDQLLAWGDGITSRLS
ncbi:MAG: exodeoxyribonuclease I [Xanthomonadales bacterium]|nr:exodeoxyribonuclease I [Xanthomonadales bacterium]MCB1634400.1 exodeoxyribonuclease I [Xanthomonadales bacterium]